MDFITHIREAFSNLTTAKLRSFLAILGILVGTGSVVALVYSGRLATEHALEQFKTLGTNLLAMNLSDDQQAGGAQQSQTRNLTLKDIPKLMSATEQVVEAAPYTNLYQQLRFAGQSFSGSVLGTTDAFYDITKIEILKGRFISFLDRHNFFCVIGNKVASSIQEKGVDPLYKQIQIGNSFLLSLEF